MEDVDITLDNFNPLLIDPQDPLLVQVNTLPLRNTLSSFLCNNQHINLAMPNVFKTLFFWGGNTSSASILVEGNNAPLEMLVGGTINASIGIHVGSKNIPTIISIVSGDTLTAGMPIKSRNASSIKF